MVKWITFILAAVGLAAGIYTVATARQELPKPPPSRPPSVNPFASGVAAIGTVEPASREITVIAPDQGMVSEVFVSVNDAVEKGRPLFRIDARPLEAQRIEAEAVRMVAAAQVKRLESSPRAEDVPPAQAAVSAAEADLADAKDQWHRTQDAVTKNSASESELARRGFAVDAAAARLSAARAELDRIKAGAWSEDVAVARGQLAAAEARLKSIEIMLDRLTVRAPISGVVLKCNIEPGEFAMATPMQMTQAAVVIGDISTLHVRAQVDEEDAPLVRNGARAVARVRGGRAPSTAQDAAMASPDIPLTMLRIEPLALPKTNILGTPTERVDTRIIEVVFAVTSAGAGEKRPPIYPGQAVDVFIEAGQETP